MQIDIDTIDFLLWSYCIVIEKNEPHTLSHKVYKY